MKSLEIIRNSKFTNPKILEIGSGDGAFIRKLVKKRITIKDQLLQLSIRYTANQKLRILGLSVFQ